MLVRRLNGVFYGRSLDLVIIFHDAANVKAKLRMIENYN